MEAERESKKKQRRVSHPSIEPSSSWKKTKKRKRRKRKEPEWEREKSKGEDGCVCMYALRRIVTGVVLCRIFLLHSFFACPLNVSSVVLLDLSV